MSSDRSNTDTASIRTQVAHLLREIRCAQKAQNHDVAAEQVGWVLTLLPDHICIIRLAIDVHLAVGNFEDANALIARALYSHPHNLSLRLRRARCFLLTSRAHLAAFELRYLAQARPSHIATLVLAAQTMRAIDHLDFAAPYLRRAAACCPVDHPLSRSIVRELLDLNLIAEADTLLRNVLSPAPVLRARIFHAQGRTLEALEILESVIPSIAPDERDESFALLFKLYHQLGLAAKISSCLEQLNECTPAAVEAAARGLLAAADSRTAARVCIRSLRKNRCLLPSLGPTLLIALLALKRPRAANRLLTLIRASSPSAAPPQFAPVWPHYFAAVITHRNIADSDANTDPNPSVLGALLSRSLHMLDSALKPPCSLPSSEFTDLSRLRERCALALHHISASTAQLESEFSLDPLPFPSVDQSTTRPPVPIALAA